MNRIVEMWMGMTGVVLAYAGSLAPDGFLFCHGQAVKRADYPNLFAVVGTTYSTGSEAGDEFRLPDLRGEFVRGLDAGRGVDAGRALGSWQKATVVAHDLAPASDPTVDTLRGTLSDIGGDPVEMATHYAGVSLSYHSPTVTSSPAVSGNAGTRPRNVALNYIIKT